jgi:hypothetical protein
MNMHEMNMLDTANAICLPSGEIPARSSGSTMDPGVVGQHDPGVVTPLTARRGADRAAIQLRIQHCQNRADEAGLRGKWCRMRLWEQRRGYAEQALAEARVSCGT